MRVIFMGTPDFSVPPLLEIVGQGHDVGACYSQPPRPAGRGMEPKKSPVHKQAEALGIPVLTPKSLKDTSAQEQFAGFEPEVAVVVAYGLLLPASVLDAPKFGCLNLHASLLPRWRGAAPINRAIMAGDRESGIEVMKMEAGLDTGPVCMAERVEIGPDMTAGDLHDQLSVLGGDLIGRALAALSRDGLSATPQNTKGVTYAAKLSKGETRIDWQKPAMEVHNHIRGLSPFPGAWCEMTFGSKLERVKILRSRFVENGQSKRAGEILDNQLTVSCGSGVIQLIELQRAGKKPMKTEEFQRGAKIAAGEILL
ncbi:MAG: methionyl-tRNA formyltransferase [Stappiaceae bacterium]